MWNLAKFCGNLVCAPGMCWLQGHCVEHVPMCLRRNQTRGPILFNGLRHPAGGCIGTPVRSTACCSPVPW